MLTKTITIIGGSGYVGSRCIQTLVNNVKDIKIYSVSKSGKENPNYHFSQDKVEFIKGDALNPSSFSHIIEKSDGVINTIGKLLSVDSPESIDSYQKVNYETCMKIAQLANDLSALKKKNFVYISAERGLPFPLSLVFSDYINTKRKAEEKLINDFPNLNTYILRPGFINDSKERPYLIPLYYGVNLHNFIEKNFLDKIYPQIGDQLNLPAAGIELDVLSVFAAAAVLGKLDEKIISNDFMNDINNLKNIRLDL